MSQKFDPAAAARAAAKIRSQGGNASQAIQDVGTEIARMTEWWEGATAVAYRDQFEALQPTFKEFIGLVEKIAKQLDNLSAAKTNMEQELAGKIGLK